MTTALVLTDKISQSSTKSRKHRVLKAQFGDGYVQTAPDGINYKIDVWTLVFDNLSATDRTTLWTFLDTVGAFDTFTWTAFGDSTQKTWRITGDITERFISGGVYSVSFQAEQVF